MLIAGQSYKAAIFDVERRHYCGAAPANVLGDSVLRDRDRAVLIDYLHNDCDRNVMSRVDSLIAGGHLRHHAIGIFL